MECVDWNFFEHFAHQLNIRSHSVMECVDWNWAAKRSWYDRWIALCNGVRGLKFTHFGRMGGRYAIALCNGVRGLKYHNRKWRQKAISGSHSVMECVDWYFACDLGSARPGIALCNGVRGLKFIIYILIGREEKSHSVMECVDWNWGIPRSAKWSSKYRTL